MTSPDDMRKDALHIAANGKKLITQQTNADKVETASRLAGMESAILRSTILLACAEICERLDKIIHGLHQER